MYHAEIGASNVIRFTAEAAEKLYNKLHKYNQGARCSIVDLEDNSEIYLGTVEQVIELLGMDLEMQEI